VIPIVTPEEMRAIDAAAPEPVDVLIDRAGRATARVAVGMLGGAYGRVVDVLAGGGNNGNDGRVAATYLERRGVKVRVIDAAMRPPRLPACDLVIDAAYGTGFRGEWIAPDVVSRHGGRPLVLAVDIPSGVDALTGHAGPGVLAADRTVTFQAVKPGLVFGPGRDLAGEVEVVDIGLDVSSATQHLVDASDVAGWWPSRAVDAHKWNGAVRVIAGSPGMLGAGRLSAEAAARCGAGLVMLSSPGIDPDAKSEIIQRRIPASGFHDEVFSDLDRFGALVIGPGLGREEGALASARELIGGATLPVVIDGDGIFAAAWSAEGAAPLLRPRGRPTVITPHDGEFTLLAGHPPGADRVAAARELAIELDVVVLLKGPATVIANQHGDVLVVDHGDERLATAGTGDVLAGMIGTLLAAGVSPERSAAGAAWLHADAARRGSPRGLLAGDIVDLIPTALESL
jgi:NAD(P)H-hydrate epimerase